MTWSTDFEDLMPHTLRIDTLNSVSTDGYGTAVFTTSTGTYKARVVPKQERVVNLDGIEQVSKAVAWIKSSATFESSVRVRYSTGTVALGPLLRIEAPTDEDGVHHLKVWFG